MPMMETEFQRDARIRGAERAHDEESKERESHNKQIEAFALAAMKAPALVAAGGVAASLGFYSANFERLVSKAGSLELFNNSLSWMLSGLLCTLISPGLAYFSQLAYVKSIDKRERQYIPPFCVSTKGSRFFAIVGDCCRWLGVMTVLGAIGCVAYGGLQFINLVSILGAR